MPVWAMVCAGDGDVLRQARKDRSEVHHLVGAWSAGAADALATGPILGMASCNDARVLTCA